MPFYDYHCPMCGGFSAFRTITDRNAPARCPECQLPTRRLITAPNLSLMGAGQRQIFARNEKSRHDPRVQARPVRVQLRLRQLQDQQAIHDPHA